MFELETKILEWREKMLSAGIKSPVPLEELESHLRERIDDLKVGLSEADAFQSAVKEFGDGAVLNQEFSKAKSGGFWFARGQSLLLMILSLWFVMIGLNCMAVVFRQLYYALCAWWRSFNPDNLNSLHTWFYSWFTLTKGVKGCLFVLIGVGLLRRRNGWRIAALVASFYWCLRLPFYIQVISSDHEKLFDHGSNLHVSFGYMGMSLPIVFFYIIPVVNFVFAFWAIYYLTRPRTRNLFRRATAG